MFLQTCKTFMYRLFFTKEGDLDLGWFFVGLMGLVGSAGFMIEVLKNGHGSVAGWAFLGSAFASVLIAAVPIAKARILAQSRVPGDVASGIAESASEIVQGFTPHQWVSGDPDAGIL
jgi:hypothetical protein